MMVGAIPTAELSGNSLTVANALNALLGVSAMQGVIADLAALSGTTLENALASIDPLRNASINMALAQTQFAFSDLLFSRLFDQRVWRRFAPFEKERAVPQGEKVSVWAQGFGLFSREKGRDTNPTFEVTSAGFLAALDSSLGELGLLGTGIGYAQNVLRQSDNLGKSSSESIFGTLYGTFWQGPFFVDSALWGGYNWIEGNRHVSFPGFNAQAKADWHSWQLTPHLDLGYSAFFSSGWGVEPFAALDWPFLFTSEFQEEGASPLNMQIRSRCASMARCELGVSFCQGRKGERWALAARQTVSYVYEKPFSTGRVEAFLAGQTEGFIVETFLEGQSLFSPAAELFLKSENGLFLSLTYEGEFGRDYSANEVLGRVGWEF